MSNTNLSIKILRESIERLRPTIYYGTDEGVPQGQVLQIQNSLAMPETWYLLHPGDLSGIRAHYPGFRFVHVRDWEESDE